MSSENQKQLHIYKASAGSGKTYRLAGEYIRLLFAAPNNFRHILAVTFTNKATDEMKSRIVKELHNLANGNKSGYLKEIMDEFNLSQDDVCKQSKSILESILHNYSSFSISTIDKFFQQTMRAFTREMGITGGYRVEVENTAYLPEVVDLMLNDLDKTDNSDLMSWLLEYMKDNIEDNKSWKINQSIVELSTNLFDERFITLSEGVQEQIKDKESLRSYKRTLYGIIKEFEEQLKEIGTRAQQIVNKHNLQFNDFVGGSRSQFFKFNIWATGTYSNLTATFLKFPDNLEAWSAKKAAVSVKEAISATYNDGLNDYVNQIINLFDKKLSHYFTAKEILKHFNTLGILNDVNERLQDFRRESNMLFLSDTTQLLNKIIANDESPFVYEKIGTRLNHFMIDEFQDTSTMQWNNFRPLLQDSIASGNFNLIVGDVKQSIYRWRNSDWRLLEEQISKDFHIDSTQHHNLGTNWRSDGNIILFNNVFFKEAATVMQQEFLGDDEGALQSEYLTNKIEEAYQHVHQELAAEHLDKKGQVTVSFFETENKQDCQEKTLQQLVVAIESLQDDGFNLKDIAILVRTRKEAVDISEYLLKHKNENPESKYRYDFISNEALLLKNAAPIKTVVALLKYINSPFDKITRVIATFEYLKYTTTLANTEILNTNISECDEDIPETLKAQLEGIITLPLYEMTEALFDLIKGSTSSGDIVYIQAFLDLINDFTSRKSADLNGFIEWWEETKDKRSLFSPDDQDAIQLMTIHKSKGLEFKAVILPFADWQFPPRSGQNILWCKPEVEPFNQIGIVPVVYSNQLNETIFKEEYLQEKLYSYIDNLNLLYVTFTRPKHRLIIFAPMPNKTSNKDSFKIASVSDLLWLTLSQRLFTDVDKYGKCFDEETLTFCLNEVGESTIKSNKTLALENAQDESIRKWESIPFRERVKMRLTNQGYFSDDGSRDFGTLMHEVVSEIKTLDNLDEALNKRVQSGEISSNNKAELHSLLAESLSLPIVKEWYSGKYDVLNEQQLLHPSLFFIRPDRIMIDGDEVIIVDYKFGELEESKYKKQVERYANSIRNMGYKSVKGYIFYVRLQKVIQVV